MSCIGTLGRKLPCNDAQGGIIAAYIIENGTMTVSYDVTNTTVIDDLGAITCFEWDVDVKSSSNLIQTLTSDQGTTTVNQVVTLGLKKPEWSTDNEILLWAYGNPHLVIHYNTGRAVVVGLRYGSNITTAVSDSGAALGDPNIYTITVDAMSANFANDLSGATVDDPFAGMSTPPTVVAGMDVAPA
jgi:hypothetical protein